MTRRDLEALVMEARQDLQREKYADALERWAPALLHAAYSVDLSQRALALMLGIHPNSFCGLLAKLKAKRPDPLHDLIPRLREHLGVETDREAERAAAYVGACMILGLNPTIQEP